MPLELRALLPCLSPRSPGGASLHNVLVKSRQLPIPCRLSHPCAATWVKAYLLPTHLLSVSNTCRAAALAGLSWKSEVCRPEVVLQI